MILMIEVIKMEHDQYLCDTHGHQSVFQMSFSCSEKYDQFVNWLCDEFYFFQQDQDTALTIYFPNGKLRVKKEVERDSTLLSKLTIESKCKIFGSKIEKKLSAFLNYIERYHKLSQI